LLPPRRAEQHHSDPSDVIGINPLPARLPVISVFGFRQADRTIMNIVGQA
jgi:hypothetical protein